METIFDFMQTDCEYIGNITSKIKLYIKRINHSVALLYFMDELNNKINIPDSIVVYTMDYSQNTIMQKKVINPIDNNYILCWTDDYIVELNKKIKLNIKNQRKWVIY